MIAAFAAISVGLTSCDLEEQVKATSISINQTSVALKVGQKIDLDAMVYPLSVETQRVVWASKDPAIAAVDPYSGIVMGLSAGKTYITAVACDGSNVTASVPVTITSDASSLVPESPSTEAVPEVFNVKITTGTQMLALNDDGTTTTVTIDKNGNLSPAPKSGALLVYPADAAAAGKLVNMMNQSGTKEDFQKKYGIMTSTDGSPLKSLVSALKVVNNRNTPMSIVASSSASLTRAENVVYYNSLNVTKGWQTGSGRAILCTIAPGDSAYVAAPVGSDINIETVDGEVIVAHQTLEAGQEYPLVIEEKVIKVEKIELQMSEVTVAKGDTLHFSATVYPEDANNTAVNWTSSDPSVLTVDKEGVVTAVGGGHATITATAADGSDVSASCEVTVVILVEEIKLGSKLYSVKKGSTVRAAATIVPVEADNRKVTWSSADPTIATVDKEGVITGVSVGKTTITVTAADGSGVSASCTVAVEPDVILVDGINFPNYYFPKVKKGETISLDVTVSPENATNRELSWSSADEKIATVDKNGVVTGVGYGRTIITATATDGSGITASCAVLVGDEIAMNFIDFEFAPGQKGDLSLEKIKKSISGDFLILGGETYSAKMPYNGGDKLVGQLDAKADNWTILYPAITPNANNEYVYDFANQSGTFEDFCKNYNVLSTSGWGTTDDVISSATMVPRTMMVIVKNNTSDPFPVYCNCDQFGKRLSQMVFSCDKEYGYWYSSLFADSETSPLCTVAPGATAYVAVPCAWGVTLCDAKGNQIMNRIETNYGGLVYYLNLNTGVGFQEGLFNSEIKW